MYATINLHTTLCRKNHASSLSSQQLSSISISLSVKAKKMIHRKQCINMQLLPPGEGCWLPNRTLHSSSKCLWPLGWYWGVRNGLLQLSPALSVFSYFVQLLDRASCWCGTGQVLPSVLLIEAAPACLWTLLQCRASRVKAEMNGLVAYTGSLLS